MGHWIKTGDRTYRCSACGEELTTSYPIEQWTRCPFCHTEMEESDNGDSEAESNS